MGIGLNVSDLANVTINVSPQAAPNANFNTLLIIGDSSVISTVTRIKFYTSLALMAADFTSPTAPEYIAAQAYFAQNPTPTKVAIGVKASGESFLQALTACANASGAWYAAMFSCTTMPVSADYTACESYIEATNRVLGITETESAAITTPDTTSEAYLASHANLNRTVIQYSSSAYYAIAAFFGRALSVDFNANKSTITMMYKNEASITAETLTETQAAQLKSTNCNVFVNYANNAAIVQYGTVANGRYFDELMGLDWLQNAIQTQVFNLFYTNTTKIPQTDAGAAQVVAAISTILDQAVANGLIAPGIWDAAGFGALNYGDFLKSGYYIYIAPMATQSTADRAARLCPPITIAVKLAGAIHTLTINVNVNR